MIRKVIYVLIPLMSLLLSAPIVTEVLPREVSSGEYHWQFWLIGLASALGLLSAPGYLAAVFRRSSSAGLSWKRWWLRLSLVLALLSCLVGVGFTVLAFWPVVVLPVAAAAMCVRLILILEQGIAGQVRVI